MYRPSRLSKLSMLVPAFCFVVGIVSSAATAGAAIPSTSANKTLEKQAKSLEVELIMPGRFDRGHLFYKELLREALNSAGYNPSIQITKPVPYQRALMMLDKGEATIQPMFRTLERDSKYIPVRVELTEGFVAKRILLVQKGKADRFSGVHNLAEMRASGAVGAFGSAWYDYEVWTFNRLASVPVDGDWNSIYGMLARGSRGIDYFSRALTEIGTDEKMHPELDVERNLLFVYDGDFIFYLSPAAASYRTILEDALKKAVASGLLHKLVEKFWSADMERFKLSSRRVIKLDSPPSGLPPGSR